MQGVACCTCQFWEGGWWWFYGFLATNLNAELATGEGEIELGGFGVSTGRGEEAQHFLSFVAQDLLDRDWLKAFLGVAFH